MKLIGTIALALVVIVASLLFIVSSICMVSGASVAGGRILGGVFALCCLGVIVGGMSLIARIHGKP
ncbi:MAG TPA: hypothetical protein VHV29_05655 [Terriglobales bacterium]|jgi:hypothetical protein|nr:hypothetical protein [Terriglobales bacterium]